MATVSAKNRIKAGLALRPGTNTNYESLDAVIGAPFTFADLSKLVSGVHNKREIMKTKAETVGKRLQAFEETQKAKLAAMGKIHEQVGNGATQITDTWSDNARQQQLVRIRT